MKPLYDKNKRTTQLALCKFWDWALSEPELNAFDLLEQAMGEAHETTDAELLASLDQFDDNGIPLQRNKLM